MDWFLLALLSALIQGGAMLLLKRDLVHERDTQTLALYALGGVLLLGLSGKVDFGAILTHAGWLILVKSVILAFAFYLSILALRRLPMSVYAPLKNLSPIFLLIFGWGFLGEALDPVQLLGLFLVIGGALLLDVDIRKPHQLAQIRRFLRSSTVIVMLLYAVVLSFAPILDRFILRETNPATNAFWVYLIVSLIFWADHIVRERRLPFQGLGFRELGWLAATGVLVVLADVALFAAIAIPGTILVVLIAIRRLSSLFATLASGKAFHEEHILYKGSLCIVMIAGTVLLLV